MKITTAIRQWREMRALTRPPVRLWTRDFITICLAQFGTGAAIQMLISAFPLYLAACGLSAKRIGMVVTGYTICTLIMRTLAGGMVDRRGRWIVVVLTMILFTLPLLGFMLWPLMIVIILCRVLQGVGAAGMSTGLGTMVADVLPRERFAEGIGYCGLFSAAATAVGPAMGVRLAQDGNGSAVFVLTAILMLGCLILILFVNYERKGTHPIEKQQKSAPPQRGFLWRFFDKPAVPAALVCFLLNLCVGAVVNYMAPFAVSLGIRSAGLYFTLEAVSMFFTRFLSGRLSRRYGYYRMLMWGMAIMFFSIVLIGFVHALPLLLFSALLYGAGCGLAWPTFNVLCLINSEPANRGRALSTYYISNDLGVGLGALLWGFVIDATGYRSIFLFCSAIAVVTLGLAVWLKKKHPVVYGEQQEE